MTLDLELALNVLQERKILAVLILLTFVKLIVRSKHCLNVIPNQRNVSLVNQELDVFLQQHAKQLVVAQVQNPVLNTCARRVNMINLDVLQIIKLQ